ncbi:MAG: universal stress protein [Acidobacteria bacterium]|nr:universal stress protein [Acidobacteriota bacterium]
MLQVRTILAPTDLSEGAGRALDHAAAMALHYQAKLLCLHVIAPAPHNYQLLGMRAPELTRANLDEAAGKLREQVEQETPGCDVEALVVTGEPAHRIEVVAKERAADLVVMATHGYGRFRRMLLGSVAAKVLHDVACPVLTGVHLEEAGAGPKAFRTVACAVGLRDQAHSKKALAWAADFAESWGAQLHAIHVPPSIDWSAGEWFPDETQALVKEAAQEKLAALIAELGCKAEIHTGGVEALRYVPKVIREIGADVLVTGRSSEHGLLGGGGDAFGLIRESPCPVISV